MSEPDGIIASLFAACFETASAVVTRDAKRIVLKWYCTICKIQDRGNRGGGDYLRIKADERPQDTIRRAVAAVNNAHAPCMEQFSCSVCPTLLIDSPSPTSIASIAAGETSGAGDMMDVAGPQSTTPAYSERVPSEGGSGT